MLVFSRKIGEEFVIGDNIKVAILARNGANISLGIEAPKDIKILRTELMDDRGNRKEINNGNARTTRR